MSIRGKLSKLTDEQLRQVRLALEEKTGNGSLRQQFKTLQSLSNSTDGVLAADWQIGKSEARTELGKQLTAEIGTKASLQTGAMEALHTVEETPTRLKRVSETNKLLHESQTEISQNSIKIAQNATNRGLSIQNEGQRQLAEVEVEKKKKTDEIEIQTERARSEIKIDEQRNLKRIELDAHREETQIDVIAALVARVPEQFEVEMLTQRLFGYYDKKQALLLEADTQANRKKMKRLDKNIKLLEKAIDERSQGLIQGNSRPELRGLEEREQGSKGQ